MIKEEKEYWLITLQYLKDSTEGTLSLVLEHFPDREYLTNRVGTNDYAITFLKELTEEQFNKLMK